MEDELYWNFLVDSEDIRAEVEDGVVNLYGTARSWQEVDAAIKNAFEAGARSVRSHITVNEARPFYPYYYYGGFHDNQ